MFDPWKQSKLVNALQHQSVGPARPIEDIGELIRLAGISQPDPGKEMTRVAGDIARYQREHNIRPGTPEWFRLWFAKPTLTGEKPYETKQ